MELYSIPSTANQFNKYQDSFFDLVSTNATAWGIPAANVTKITALRSKWAPAYKAQADEYTASKANKIARNNAQEEYVVEIRNIIEQFILNKSVVPEEKKATLGIKTKKQGVASTESQSQGFPVIEIRSKAPLAHSIFFHDSVATTSKAKPNGVAFCELRFKVVETGASAPISADDFTDYELISKNGAEVHFKDTQRGKTVHYFSRWRRNDGSTGPLSSFSSGCIIS
jgi:hypothetical protein